MPYVNVYNNIFYKCGTANAFAFQLGSAAYPGPWATGDNVIIRNNVFLACNATESAAWGWFSMAYCANTIADHNYFGGINYAAKSVSETGMVNGVNPRFVNESAYDFHLQTNSPLIDAGVAVASFSNDSDGVSRPQGKAWDIGPYETLSTASPNTNPVISLSPASLTYGSTPTNTTSNLTITVQNTGGGTLVGTATVPAPFSIVSGGSYSLGANQSQTVTVSFTPQSTGSFTNSIRFTGGAGMVAGVSGTGVNPAPALTTTFPATAGTITAPFVVTSGLVGTSYVSQSVETGVTTGGKAVYSFSITNAGSYVVQVLVNAGSSAANSCYVNIDAQPQDPGMIWDIPVTAGFEQRQVSWRGNGTDVSNQFVPQIFNLTVGTHQLIVVGREANVQLQSFTISPTLPTPQNLRVITP